MRHSGISRYHKQRCFSCGRPLEGFSIKKENGGWQIYSVSDGAICCPCHYGYFLSYKDARQAATSLTISMQMRNRARRAFVNAWKQLCIVDESLGRVPGTYYSEYKRKILRSSYGSILGAHNYI